MRGKVGEWLIFGDKTHSFLWQQVSFDEKGSMMVVCFLNMPENVDWNRVIFFVFNWFYFLSNFRVF
jgi:hypothetical protein